MDDRPLHCCVDELSDVKKLMDGENNTEADERDKVKLSQKTSSISLHIYKSEYYIKTKIKVPDDYPESQIR